MTSRATDSTALMLDGSNGDGGSVASIRELLIEAVERCGWQVTALPLAELDIHHCVGCFGCWS